MINKLFREITKKNYIYLSCWIFLILSINIKINDLKIDYFFNLANIFNTIRYLGGKIVFIFLLLEFIKNYKYIKINIIHLLLLLFQITLLFSYIYNCFFYSSQTEALYNIFDFEQYEFIFSYISTILFFILINNFDKTLSKKIFYIFYLIIFAYSLIILIPIIYNFTFKEINTLWFYEQETFKANQEVFGQTNQRVTGIARMMVVLFSFFLFYYSHFSKNLFNKNNLNKIFLSLFFIFFFSFCIWGFQSRGAFISYILIILLFFIFEKLEIIKKFLIFLLCIFSIFIFNNFSNSKKSVIENNKIERGQVESRILNLNENLNLNLNENLNKVSSGRIQIWKRSIEKIKNKIIIGYGEMGDRRILTTDKTNVPNDEKHLWDSNASNSFLYSLLSGGIIGAIFFLLAFFYLIILIFNILKNNQFEKLPIENKISIVLIIIILIRNFYENSFSQFGIDLLLLLSCYQILIKNYSTK